MNFLVSGFNYASNACQCYWGFRSGEAIAENLNDLGNFAGHMIGYHYLGLPQGAGESIGQTFVARLGLDAIDYLLPSNALVIKAMKCGLVAVTIMKNVKEGVPVHNRMDHRYCLLAKFTGATCGAVAGIGIGYLSTGTAALIGGSLVGHCATRLMFNVYRTLLG